MIRTISQSLVKIKASRSRLIQSVAEDGGMTPLHYTVKILLENGADPHVENDLGMNAFEICEKCGPFPSVRKLLWKHVRDLYL